MRTVIKLLAIVALALVLIQPGQATTSYAQKKVQFNFPEKMKDQVQYLSTQPMLLSANMMGIQTIQGKDISIIGNPPAQHPQPRVDNIPIGVDSVIHENEPTIAANPVDRKKLVAGSHFLREEIGNFCVVYTSSNSGISWTAPVIMPQLTASSFCSDPVLAYAPDGSRVYYAHMDIKLFTEETDTTLTVTHDYDILVSFSDDNGRSWTGPSIALDGDATIIHFNKQTGEVFIHNGFFYDKPWIATPMDTAQKNWLYVTATRFDAFEPFDCHIAFARSSDKSTTWDAPTLLDESLAGCGNPVVVQGSRPAGGKGSNVLVAWYNSGSDGFLQGGFEIRTRHSSDHGATWDDIVTAAADSYEAPFWLGPKQFYHRWWGVMYPDVEIDGKGVAHVAYTHDPAENPRPGFSNTAEDGDIRYITSTGAPYNNWSSPITVNDDGMVRAQGWATLETQTNNGATRVYLIWEDHRLSPQAPAVFPNSSNFYYDIFSSKKRPNGSGWFANRRVSDASSIVDFVFIGDYFDLVANSTLIYGIWTDRRDKTNVFDLEDDVFGSWRLLSSGP